MDGTIIFSSSQEKKKRKSTKKEQSRIMLLLRLETQLFLLETPKKSYRDSNICT